MKYWRGYLVAAIVAACTWGLQQFAAAHSTLVDMVYPYVTRLMQDYLAGWSAAAPYCVWQVALLVFVAVVLASVVLMIVFHWNPIQWFGWVLTAVSVVLLLNTCVYGMNDYAGSVAEDIRLQEADYTVTQLQEAAQYYRDQANALAEQVQRDSSGNVRYPDFDEMNQLAENGFHNLTYESFYSVFAGQDESVKQLDMAEQFLEKGQMGIFVPITGEAAVDPRIPDVCMPFAICQQMALRRAISGVQNSYFAAFLSCTANESVEFRYTGYMLAYIYCYNELEGLAGSSASAAAAQLAAGESGGLRRDVKIYRDFFGSYTEADEDNVCDLLVSWHIQTVVLPSQIEEEKPFDPTDETQVDMTGLPNVK